MKMKTLSLSMKNVLASLVIALVGVFTLVSSASAGCMQEGQCFDQYTGIVMGGSTNFASFGAGVFEGESGGVLIEKSGYGSIDQTLNISGDNCVVNCQNGSFMFKAIAGELVTIESGAVGTTSGNPVSVVNEGGILTGATFEFGRVSFGSGN